MTTLRLQGAGRRKRSTEAGSWGHLVAWFSELVLRLDNGDLAGAAEAQAEIERHGFKISFRRSPRRDHSNTNANHRRPGA